MIPCLSGAAVDVGGLEYGATCRAFCSDDGILPTGKKMTLQESSIKAICDIFGLLQYNHNVRRRSANPRQRRRTNESFSQWRCMDKRVVGHKPLERVRMVS